MLTENESGIEKTASHINDANRLILSAETRAKTEAAAKPEFEIYDEPDISELLPTLSWKSSQWLFGLIFLLACTWFFFSVTHMAGNSDAPADDETTLIQFSRPKDSGPTIVSTSHDQPPPRIPPPPKVNLHLPPPTEETPNNAAPATPSHPVKPGPFIQ